MLADSFFFFFLYKTFYGRDSTVSTKHGTVICSLARLCMCIHYVSVNSSNQALGDFTVCLK